MVVSIGIVQLTIQENKKKIFRLLEKKAHYTHKYKYHHPQFTQDLKNTQFIKIIISYPFTKFYHLTSINTKYLDNRNNYTLWTSFSGYNYVLTFIDFNHIQ